MTVESSLAGGVTLPPLVEPLVRLANVAVPGLNVREGVNPVGAIERNSFAVPDEAARESIPDAREQGAQAGEVRRPASTPTISRAELDALIAREYWGLRKLLERHTRDPELAADLINDAICTAWEKWQAGEIAQPGLIAGFVFRVAMNLLRNHRRSVGDQEHRRAGERQLETLQAEPEADSMDQGIAKKVRRILESMTPVRDRNVIVRFYLQEEDRASICRDLGLTAEQFSRVLHRARRRLLELAQAHGIKGGDLFSMLLVVG